MTKNEIYEALTRSHDADVWPACFAFDFDRIRRLPLSVVHDLRAFPSKGTRDESMELSWNEPSVRYSEADRRARVDRGYPRTVYLHSSERRNLQRLPCPHFIKK